MYISDLDLIKARLTIEGRLNQSEIIKLILRDWSVDEKQRFMAVGERYYAGRHDILNHDFRQSVVYDKVLAENSDDGKDHEIAQTITNSNNSNMHNIHPFFRIPAFSLESVASMNVISCISFSAIGFRSSSIMVISFLIFAIAIKITPKIFQRSINANDSHLHIKNSWRGNLNCTHRSLNALKC